MKKRFNITGTCYPENHYLMDNSKKLEQIMELIEYGEYFTINRPRQYGKTTTMSFLAKQLRATEDYLPIELNFQGIDRQWLESDKAFAQMFINEIYNFLKYNETDAITTFLEANIKQVIDMNSLSKLITEMVRQTNKKLILFIDEVDTSSNYQAFLSLLGMLRTKYLSRKNPQHATFYSIVLAGVHDIKSLKYKLRNPEEAQYNSPWNIATDFDVRMSFNSQEIEPMLEQYSKAENVKMDVSVIAERLHYYTSGYPFLVSKLCKNIAEKMVAKRVEKVWILEDVETAVQMIMRENNTNFDSLIKNLENRPELYDLVNRILIDGERIAFSPDEPIIQLGIMYGIFKSNGTVKVHNRIYEQRIYNYLSAKISMKLPSRFSLSEHFITEGGGLDMEAVLHMFQQFMKEKYSEKSKGFIEREGRTIFLAYLSPILNGKGYSFREVQVSTEKRLDIVVTYLNHRYILELKLWYGQKYHEEGLLQLADYLDIHGVDEGFLVIFDDRKEKKWQTEKRVVEGKEIFMVWV